MIAADSFRNASAVIVGKGDTVYALSRRHGVDIRAIIEANDLSAPFHLNVGQRIVLPRYAEHEVTRGDTLSGLAARYDAGMYELARLNGIKPPYTIFVGQRLRLPGGGTAVSAAKPIQRKPAAPLEVASAKPDQTKPAQTKPTKPPSWSVAGRAGAAKPKPRPVLAKRPASPRALPKPKPRSGKGFLWPLRGRVISSFGAKPKGFFNDGINIVAPRGTSIQAAQNGVVVYAGNELRGFGNLLLIKHDGGWVTAYAHADKLLVRRGDAVAKGQRVATVGTTGSVTKPQLHFEIRKGKRARNPVKYLRRA